MSGYFKRLKLSYLLYNFFHKEELYHNVPVYKKLGLNKKYFSPVSSKDFEQCQLPLNHLSATAPGIEATTFFKATNKQNQSSLLDFEENGFAIINNYLSPQLADAANEEIERLIEHKKVNFKYGNKIMFAIHQSKRLYNIGNDQQLLELLSALLKGNAVLFQSINFLKGSEQETHSDSIHMTTYPLGGLLGVWIALEDIDEQNGPLHYYPGSHKLPYYLNKDYNNEGNKLFIGDKDYDSYEKMLEEKITALQLKKETLKIKKGDLLIWHANLLHGGEKHLDKQRTRKSMVLHYYNENCVCYHEITQRPALIKKMKKDY